MAHPLWEKINGNVLLCGTGSGCNSATRTFDGVDVMGRRLAEEVSIDKFILEKLIYRAELASMIFNLHFFFYSSLS